MAMPTSSSSKKGHYAHSVARSSKGFKNTQGPGLGKLARNHTMQGQADLMAESGLRDDVPYPNSFQTSNSKLPTNGAGMELCRSQNFDRKLKIHPEALNRNLRIRRQKDILSIEENGSNLETHNFCQQSSNTDLRMQNPSFSNSNKSRVHRKLREHNAEASGPRL